MGFKVIETEEEIRSAFSAGLMWWKADDDAQFYKKNTKFNINVTLGAWRNRAYMDDPSHMSWEAYVLVEDEDG